MSKNVNMNLNVNIPLVLVVLTLPIFLWEPPISVDVAQLHVVDALKKRGVSQRRRKVEMGSLLQIARKTLLALMGLGHLINHWLCGLGKLVCMQCGRPGEGGVRRGRKNLEIVDLTLTAHSALEVLISCATLLIPKQLGLAQLWACNVGVLAWQGHNNGDGSGGRESRSSDEHAFFSTP